MHILLNELADAAALQATDHQGVWWAELAKAKANVKLLWQVCRRIWHLEAYIRQSADDPSITAPDIINSFEYEASRRRDNATSKGRERVDKLNSDQGHLLVHPMVVSQVRRLRPRAKQQVLAQQGMQHQQ